jgi:hypothetical protein
MVKDPEQSKGNQSQKHKNKANKLRRGQIPNNKVSTSSVTNSLKAKVVDENNKMLR